MKILWSIAFTLIQTHSFSQNKDGEDIGLAKSTNLNIGFGIGVPYGFYGGRINYLVSHKAVIFGSVGSALVGLGYNGGVVWRITPATRNCLTLSAFYGTNSVIKIRNASQFDKIYSGPSASLGYEIRIKKGIFSQGFFHIELVVPIRSDQFNADYNSIKQNPSIQLGVLAPVSASVGYQFDIFKYKTK